MNKNFKVVSIFISAVMVSLLVGCGGGGGGGSDTSNNDNTNQSSSLFHFNNPARVLVVNQVNQPSLHSAAAVLAEEETTSGTMIQVNDSGEVAQVTTVDLDIKDVQKGPDGMLYVNLTTAYNNSYLIRVDPATNDYVTIDSMKIADKVSGHNPTLQWDSSFNLYYEAVDSGTHYIKKYGTDQVVSTLITSDSESSLGDWLYDNGGVYFTLDKATYSEIKFVDANTASVSEIYLGTSVGWIQKYELVDDAYLRAGVNTNGTYTIMTFNKNEINSHQSLVTMADACKEGILNPTMFVEVNGVKLLFSAEAGGQIFQIYPFNDQIVSSISAESVTILPGADPNNPGWENVMYVTGQDTGEPVWAEIYYAGDWDYSMRILSYGYDGFDEQQARFNYVIASSISNILYFHAIDSSTGKVVIGNYNTMTETSTAQTLNATSVMSDIPID